MRSRAVLSLCIGLASLTGTRNAQAQAAVSVSGEAVGRHADLVRVASGSTIMVLEAAPTHVGLRGAIIGALVGAGAGYEFGRGVCDGVPSGNCARNGAIGGALVGALLGYGLERLFRWK